MATFDYPHPVRVAERGRSVVILGRDEKGRLVNFHLSPDQADAYADRLKQAARQVRHGVVPVHELEVL